jgi:hypothetical protein
MENEAVPLNEQKGLTRRRDFIKAVDRKGLIATPANSYLNELVIEAARLSILNEGEMVQINYGNPPRVKLRRK